MVTSDEKLCILLSLFYGVCFYQLWSRRKLCYILLLASSSKTSYMFKAIQYYISIKLSLFWIWYNINLTYHFATGHCKQELRSLVDYFLEVKGKDMFGAFCCCRLPLKLSLSWVIFLLLLKISCPSTDPNVEGKTRFTYTMHQVQFESLNRLVLEIW